MTRNLQLDSMALWRRAAAATAQLGLVLLVAVAVHPQPAAAQQGPVPSTSQAQDSPVRDEDSPSPHEDPEQDSAGARGAAQADVPGTRTPESPTQGAAGPQPREQPPPEGRDQARPGANRTSGPPAQRAAEEAPPSQAVEHYQRGRDLYHAGRYREAIAELQQALRLDPASPELTYNVARVYELLGEIDTAIRYYARSRDLLPPEAHEERARTNTTIQRLEGAKRHAQVVPPSQLAAAQDVDRRGVADAAFWSVSGVGVGALAGGAATGVLALQYGKRAQQFVLGVDGNAADRHLEVRRADRLALASDALLAAGATLTITSLLLLALREKPSPEKKDAARLSAGFGPSRAVFVVEGAL